MTDRNLPQSTRPTERGMSLVELMMTTLVMTTVLAIAVPAGQSALNAMELGSARQAVGLALRTSRLRAVAANRPMRLRLNCPRAGQFRVVEVTGVTGTDTAPDRCDEANFGYPGLRDSDPATPRHDGPLQSLNAHIDSLSGPDLEFSPNGTTRVLVGGVAQQMTDEALVRVTRDGLVKEVSVNALGRIDYLD